MPISFQASGGGHLSQANLSSLPAHSIKTQVPPRAALGFFILNEARKPKSYSGPGKLDQKAA